MIDQEKAMPFIVALDQAQRDRDVLGAIKAISAMNANGMHIIWPTDDQTRYEIVPCHPPRQSTTLLADDLAAIGVKLS